MSKAKKEEIVEEAVEGAPKKKGKLMLIIILVVLLAGGGGAGWYFMQGKKDPHAAPEKKVEAPPVFEKLEQFTVNLVGGEHYLQTEVSLKVSDPKLSEEIKLHMPEIRDVLLRLLSSKQAEDLATMEGKKQLSEEIQKQINKVLGVKKPNEGVLAVLFTSFIIQ